jgi:glycerol-3-phosphate O-acyltransferase
MNERNELEDVVFVPVTIDYERTLELSSMASEVMGKSKMNETLPNLMKWIGGSALSRIGRSVRAVVGGVGASAEERNVRLQGGGTNLFNVKKEPTQMNEKGLFNAGYGPPLDIPNNGSMSLHFGLPISLSEYVTAHARGETGGETGGATGGETKDSDEHHNRDSSSSSSSMVDDLAYHIMDQLHATSICHGTHLVASTILMYRSAGSITFTELEEHVRWLAIEVQARGMAVQMAPRHPTQWPTAIRRALGLLKGSVRELRPGVFAANDYSSSSSLGSTTMEDPRIHWIELSILRNKLIHLFYEEALWAVALHSKTRHNTTTGTTGTTGTTNSTNEMMVDVLFMDDMFSTEFIRNRARGGSSNDYFTKILHTMTVKNKKKGLGCVVFDVNHKNTNIAVAAGTGETMFAFLCSMLWPFIGTFHVPMYFCVGLFMCPLCVLCVSFVSVSLTCVVFVFMLNT